MISEEDWSNDAENTFYLNNISQYYCFYCLFYHIVDTLSITFHNIKY